MARDIGEGVQQQVRIHAVQNLQPHQVRACNLSILPIILEEGDEFGPPTSRMQAERSIIVVFADDDPTANWGHSCRYLIYDASTAELIREVPARLPIGGLQRFYTSVTLPTFEPPEGRLFWPPGWRCPRIIPDGNRYALLFAGFTMDRHLNDMEFCYRMLVNDYGVPADNVLALSFDGTMTVVNDYWTGTSAAPANWPGDGTPFQIRLTGQGTLTDLQTAFETLSGKLGPDDLLFIHTNNHGDTDTTGSYIGYPGSFPSGPSVDWSSQWVSLYASDFGGLLAALPSYKSLIVMMEQCGSGGFGADVTDSSTASVTSFSAACEAGQSSYGTSYLGASWDAFAYQWIAAVGGKYPNGTVLASNPDTDGSSVVDTSDAFTYASTNDATPDTPISSGVGSDPGGLTLAEQYRFWWMWCWFWDVFAEPYYERVLSGELSALEFTTKLNRLARDLQAPILSEIEKTGDGIRDRLGARVEAALGAAFD
jgi:hypothetical protein